MHNHKAIGLIERLIQTIKSRLACFKTAARNQFNLKASINSIIFQLLICRQKTINISPRIWYKRILNKYLDLETVRWEELIFEENWDVEARSDTELENNRDKLSKDAARRKNADPRK